jgi:ABC-type lipoprotein release transport system permease subunit
MDPEARLRAERLRRRRTRRRMIRLAVVTFMAGIGVGMAAILIYLTLAR